VVVDAAALKVNAEKAGINFFYAADEKVIVSIDETTSIEDANALLAVFATTYW